MIDVSRVVGVINAGTNNDPCYLAEEIRPYLEQWKLATGYPWSTLESLSGVTERNIYSIRKKRQTFVTFNVADKLMTAMDGSIDELTEYSYRTVTLVELLPLDNGR